MLRILLILGLFLFAEREEAIYAQPPTLDDAIKLLKTTQPIPNFKQYAGATLVSPDHRNVISWPPEIQKLKLLYDRQLDAIKVIALAKPKRQVSLLIPYLDYMSNYAYDIIGPGPDSPSAIYQAWPAFDAILNMPDSGLGLQEYCLHAENPINYRIAALLTLRYADKERFQSVARQMEYDLRDSTPFVKYCLKNVQREDVPFWGVPDLSRLPLHMTDELKKPSRMAEILSLMAAQTKY